MWPIVAFITLAALEPWQLCFPAQAARELNREQMACLAIAEAYLASRNAFSAFDCRFTVRKRLAPTLEEAKRRDLPLYVESEGRWLRSGAKQLYSLRADPAKFKEAMFRSDNLRHDKVGGFSAQAPMVQAMVLEDGRFQLAFDPVVNFAFIRDESSRQTVPAFSPVDLGLIPNDANSNLVITLKKAIEGGASVQVSTKQADGRALVLIETTWQDPQRTPPLLQRRTYGFDPLCGYALVKYEHFFNSMLQAEASVTRLRQCENGAWFPLAAVVCQKSPLDERWFRYEFETNELTLRTPRDSEFVLELPQKTPITPDTLFPWLILTENETFAIESLPHLRSRAEKGKLEKNKKMTGSGTASATDRSFKTSDWPMWSNSCKIAVGAGIAAVAGWLLFLRSWTTSFGRRLCSGASRLGKR